jgi:hypothetical protein
MIHTDGRSGIEGQETGVTGNAKPAFGPATKDFYDSSQWAMVPTATAYIEDPAPSQRQRGEGQPAILKPSPNFNYLPALIPILHSIPQFRNALLSPEVAQKSYWVGDDWWKGSAVARARIIDTTVDEDDALGLDVVHEIQRLMAFLDNTDRAYATVESLLQLDAWKEARPKLEDPDDDLLKFLLVWSEAYQKQTPQFQLDGALRSVVSAGGSNFESFVLDSTITKRESGRAPDVYDVLDDTFFATQEGSAHIADISNVLILRLSSSRPDGNDLGCRVPATLYADRYLEENKPIIDAMFEEMRQYEFQLKDIKDQTDMLKWHTPTTSKSTKPVESLKLLQTSMKAFQSTEEPDSNDAAVLTQLQTLYDSIERKLASLDEQSQTIQKTLNSISDRFKPPVDDGVESEAPVNDYPAGQRGEDATKHPYQLYGVSTRRDVIYLLHPDPKPDAPDAKQWWRVQYDSESTSPNIIRDRVDQQQVLERATSEAASVLLVYANEAATSAKPLPLSKPLEDFVKKDNFNFLEELQKSHQGWEDYANEPSAVQGDWDKNPPGYNHDWANISAHEFHKTQQDSNMSSATLTPNTDVDVDGDTEVREIVDVTASSNASTVTIADDTPASAQLGEVMELDSQPPNAARDADMVDIKEVSSGESQAGKSRE